jgi:hypothetical protein
MPRGLFVDSRSPGCTLVADAQQRAGLDLVDRHRFDHYQAGAASNIAA